jgi:phosphoglucomutase
MPPTPIAFGTSGWRGILSDDFTVPNLRRATRAVARYLRARTKPRAPKVFVGYDTRFLSESLALETARVLSSEGVRPRLSGDFVPTPVVAHAIRRWRLDGGINLTASHNPADYQGFKFSTSDGAPAPPEVTRRIEALIRQGMRGDAPPAARPSDLKFWDPSGDYRRAVLRLVDRKVIRRARLRIVCDPVYGAGRGYLEALLGDDAAVTVIRSNRDVTFGGHGPDINEKELEPLCREVRRTRSALGLATDGDADRFGIVDAGGRFLPANLILALLADYLLESRRQRSGIARTVATTHLLDDVAAHHGVALYETPVGFKYFRDLLLEGKVFFAGEESAGLSIAGHVPEKDGILAGLLVTEMVARRRRSLHHQVRDLFRKVGPRHSRRIDHRVPPEAIESLRRRLRHPPSTLLGKRVVEVSALDGTRMTLKDGSWILLRPSGTEPLVRCYAEARNPRDVTRLLDAGRALIVGK